MGEEGTECEEFVHRVVIGVDVEAYSRRNSHQQAGVQNALDGLLGDAARAAGLGREKWKVSPGGDGMLAVLPADVDLVKVVRGFVGELAGRLAAYNGGCPEDMRFRLRAAVHMGMTVPGLPLGHAGPAPVELSRLLDSDELRRVLKASPGDDIAVLVSGAVHGAVAGSGFPGLEPERFRRLTVDNPGKGFRQDAYLYVPGAGPGHDPEQGQTSLQFRPVQAIAETGDDAARVINGGVCSGDTTVPHLPASPALAEAADNLAREVRWALEQEQKRRKIYAPEPMPARWRAAADHLTDPQVRIGVSCEGDSIAVIYRKVPRGRLVILGPAGSGKTVLAQWLALDYLNGRESSEAVPVVFSIGSWDPSTAALEQWMAGMVLRDHPFLDKATAVGLIADHRILPVLDGFDELAGNLRVMALEELNSAANRPLVLTSRLPEYESTTKAENVLYSAAAIELTGPSLEEAMAYLAVGGNKPAWTDVHNRLRSAPGDEAWVLLTEVLRNPLMAALARTIYKRRDPARLLEKRFRTPGDAEKHLLSGFLREAYESRPGDRSRWGPDRAQTALGYLADHLKQLGGNDLAWWEIGTTLPMLQRMLAVGTLCGALGWLVVGATTLPELPSDVPYPLGLVAVSMEATGFGMACGLMHGLMARFKGPPKPSRIQMRIRASTRRQGRRVRTRFRDGFIIAVLCDGIAAIFSLVLMRTPLWEKFLANTHVGADGLPFLLGIILGETLTLGLGLGLLGWLEVPVEAGTANGPLALLRMNRATVRAQSLVIGLTGGLILGTIYVFFVGPLLGLGDGIIIAILVGTGWALSLTAWGQWVIFARLWLPLTGRLPWAAVAFLDDAHQRGVLRQSGAVYQFRHARLQDHLTMAQAEGIQQNPKETG